MLNFKELYAIADKYGDTKVGSVDNFDLVEGLLHFDSEDNFYYIEIICRKKDNPGANFNYCRYLKHFDIFSKEDFRNAEPEIKKLCEDTNSRAYIYLNPRLKSVVDKYAEEYRNRYMPSKYRGSEYQLAAGRGFDTDDRPMCFLDIDTDDERVYNSVKKDIAALGMHVVAEYKSPSGGWHIVSDDKYNAKRLNLRKYDGGRNKGRFATVSLEIDKATLLYYKVQDGSK